MNKLIEDFSAYLREERMREATTIKRYVAILEEFATFLEMPNSQEGVELEKMDKATLVEFLRKSQSQAGLKPSKTLWNMRLASLRAFYAYLFTAQLVDINPALRIERLRTNPKEPIPLSLDELLALIDAMQTSSIRYQTRNVALVQIMFHCALRVSEIISLNLDQVDFANHLIANVRTKGGKQISLPFPDLVSDTLERYLPDREKLLGDASDSALFLSNRGQRLSVRSVQQLLQDYGKKAGIFRPVTPHLLRHSGATELADMGVPLRVVQEICGHASITTTQRYVHVTGDSRRAAIDGLAKKVSKRSKQRRKAAVKTTVARV